jgi:S-formylglutathione hydrolase FrmB
VQVSIVTIRFQSEALGKHASFNVIHPGQGEGPFPVLLQLHGYSDDSFSWLYNSNLVRHVADLPVIVVLPDGGTSRYLNVPLHERFGLQRYEDLLMRDIPAELNRTFQVRPGPMAIGGLSMGGYGALRLGLKYPDRFASIWAHSAGIRPLDDAFLALFDDPDDASVAHHADRLRGRTDIPRLSFDCGVDDVLIDFNRDFHRHLDGIGFPHQYREHPGAHTWEYWDEHVVEALAQHAEVLGIAPVTA